MTRNFFDAAGRVVISEQENGNSIVTTFMAYTATGQELAATSPDGAVTANFYDALDRVLEVHDPEGRVTRFVYDAAGQLIREIRAFGTALQQDYSTFTYTGNGQQASISDANGNTSTFHYDGFDRLVELRYPNASTPGVSNPDDNELFTYDLNGNVLTKTTRADDVIINTYDALNRILSKAPGSDPVVQYFYSARGQQTEIRFADLSQHVKHTYDNAGRATSTETKLPGNVVKTIAYGLDKADNILSLTHPDGVVINYTYDDSSRMTLIERGSSDLAVYSYDQIGRRTQAAYGSDADKFTDNVVNATYEPDSGLDSLFHGFSGTASDVTYNFDYNLSNQVVFRTVTNDTYQFAPVEKGETYTANGLNQYTQIVKNGTPVTLSYDPNGNLTGDGAWAYGFDAENRLISASDGTTNVTYAYDPIGRRAAKTVDGNTTLYLNERAEEILELDGSGNITRRFVYGPGIDEPVAMWDDDSTSNFYLYLYHADQQGNIIATSRNNGNIRETYTYDAFGAPDNPSGQPLRYMGRRWEAETGLYHFRSRAFSPALGRFLQTDPAGYGENVNLYAFGANDPLNGRDPSGEVWGLLVRVVKVGKRVIKAKGNFKKALKDEFASVVDNGATLLDGDLNIDDAFAVIDLATGLGSEAKAGLKALKGADNAGDAAKKADNAADSVKLNKKLASEEQVGELTSGKGTEIAGGKSGKEFRDADRVSAEHGGNPEDFSKVKSSSKEFSDGTQIQTSGVRNNKTGEVVEMKTKIEPCTKDMKCK